MVGTRDRQGSTMEGVMAGRLDTELDSSGITEKSLEIVRGIDRKTGQ